jgi:hypothetical protein
MGNTINLRLVNSSNDTNNSSIVVFQKNVTTSFDEIAVAWRVIKNLGQGWYHDFTYSYDMQIGVSDGFDNHSPKFDASPGQLWHSVKTLSGDQLQPAGISPSPEEVQVRNDLGSGTIQANVYRDGKLLATKTGVVPGQKAVFKFKPSIFLGVISQVQEGDILDSAIIMDVNTEISLLGISSAEIVMSGGGQGSSAQPFSFRLQNVKNG